MVIKAISCVCRCVERFPFIPCDYDTKVRPDERKGRPTNIAIQFYIESFGQVDVEKMELETFGYISQSWRDDRLKLNKSFVILKGDELKHVWTPDIYCVNCRSQNFENGLNPKQGMMRITQNGSVFLSAGVHLVASCYMNLRKFPFDVQRCTLKFSSYGYNSSFLRYNWKADPFVKIKRMDQFMIEDAKGGMDKEKYMSGSFDIVLSSFAFVRRVGYYILQLYVPTAMLVGLSWTMFCLNHDHTGDRITIGVTLFLTMMFLHGYANTSLPRVSYVKMVDLFMVVSLGEILIITVESIVISKLHDRFIDQEENKHAGTHVTKALKKNKGYNLFKCCCINRSCKRDKCHELENQPRNQVESQNENEEGSKALLKISGEGKVSSSNGRKVSFIPAKLKKIKWHDVIEKASMILIPFSFVSFNIWYWIISLSSLEA